MAVVFSPASEAFAAGSRDLLWTEASANASLNPFRIIGASKPGRRERCEEKRQRFSRHQTIRRQADERDNLKDATDEFPESISCFET